MPTSGLSLVGFMDQLPQAIHHLRTACVPDDMSEAHNVAEWNRARAALGHPTPNAGNPSILPIPAAHDEYIKQLLAEPWVKAAIKVFLYGNAEFKLVEIAPLLACQFHVDIDRSGHHCSLLNSPTIDDLLPICLPMAQQKVMDQSPLIIQQNQSITIKCRNLNIRPLLAGGVDYVREGYHSIVAGMQIHVALPFVHVVRLDGKCYLHNGYHRAYGMGAAGATHVPCLLRDVATPAEAGIMAEGPIWQTFPMRILTSSNPPTVGHFVDGRALPVQIRSVSRILHVTWSETIFPDE
jgi:hypothetical protein